MLEELVSKEERKIAFRDVEELQDWLIGEISRRLPVSPENIDVKQSLSSLGLDSRTAVALAGDLEKVLGRELSPTLAWDYPTIEALADHLMDPS